MTLDAIRIDATQAYLGGITFKSAVEAQSCHIMANMTISGKVTVDGDFKVDRFVISSRVTLSGQLTVNGNIDIGNSSSMTQAPWSCRVN